jgi:glycosyltransferase involved in cell wall biosynthesis
MRKGGLDALPPRPTRSYAQEEVASGRALSRRSRTAPPARRIVNIRTFFEDKVSGRIRICVPDPGLQVGGAEWFMTLLAKFSNRDVFEFIVLSYRPEPSGLRTYLESIGIRVMSATALYGYDLTYEQWVLDRLFRMLVSCRPDIVFFSSHYLFAAISPERLKPYRVAVRISNFEPDYLDSLDFESVDLLICCSEEQHAHMIKRYPKGAFLIKTGVDADQFHPVSEPAKRALRNDLQLPDKRIVLFCGRLSDPLKRTLLFQQVVDEVLKRQGDVLFLVVGYFERHRKASEREFGDFVSSRPILWRPNVRPWEVAKYFQAADLLLSVSAQGEGLSNVALQSLACGLIPVVTASSGMTELIRDAESGFIVDADEPSSIAGRVLQALDLEETQRNPMRLNARRRAESLFGLRDSVNAYEHAFHQMCEGPRGEGLRSDAVDIQIPRVPE